MTGRACVILGVGRSGTTALYSMLQHLLEHNFPGRVAYRYEPFMWDAETLPKLANEVDDEFSFMAALSTEGIYHHRRLPMLAGPDVRLDEEVTAFLRHNLCCPPDHGALLSKFIRANGRFLLLRQIADTNARIVLVVRNPVDVVNSVMDMFSLYGDEFHASDYDRFVAEASAMYPDEVVEFPRDTDVQKQAFYWLFSNLHALRTTAGDERVLVLAYEQYRSQRAAVIESLAQFIGLETPPDLISRAGESIGWISTQPNITRREVDELAPYLAAYHALILPLAGAQDVEFNPVSGATELSLKRRLLPQYRNRTPLYLADIAVARETEARALHDARVRVALLQDENAALRGSLRETQEEVENLQRDRAALAEQCQDVKSELGRVEEAYQRLTAMQAYVRSISFYTHPIKKFHAYRRLITHGVEQERD